MFEKLCMFVKKFKKEYKYFFAGIVLFLISLLTFFELVEDCLPSNNWKYDTIAFNYAFGMRNETLNGIFKIITLSGNTVSIIAITLIISIYMIHIKMKSQGIIFALNALGVWIFNEILKAIFKRPRPKVGWLVNATGYSFPSGHTMISMGIYILLIYYVLSYIKKKRTAVIIAVAIFLYTILIGLSRVYVGVHYFSDVLAGWIAGLLWVTLFVSVYRYFVSMRRLHDKEINK